MAFDKLAWQRAQRRRTGNAATRRYEKTPRGFLVRAYRNMQSRVLGLTKPHLYKGLSLLPREQFYRWSLNDPAFNYLYRVWVQSKYDRRLSPSINRIDPARGYDADNIEWVTHSVNSSLGARSAYRKTKVRRCIERLACLTN